MRLSSRLGRQAISTVRILLAGTLLVVTVVPPADAQRGLGKGRQRPPEQVPAAEPAPGEYALEGSQAIEAVNRGEGRQALAYYERTAAAPSAPEVLRKVRRLMVVMSRVSSGLAVAGSGVRPR